MNVIVIHGSYGKPFENWFPWLEQKLNLKGIECYVPTFPTPVYQNYSSWKELLDFYVEKGIVNENSVIVGHSCGATFATKYLINTKIKINALITVSGYNSFYSGDFMDELNKSFYFNENDCKLFCKDIFSFYSDNDPFIPQEKLLSFAKTIKAVPIQVFNAGHFNEAAGYKEFQQLYELILKIQSKTLAV